ncbi:hypothetical protein [Maricaulis sp. MIT060901]|uniref:hypothetical protein n=1 Tax=Maricaulis sp. MIT060901 TaxID=3096993 RepID=UPI00399B131E
MRVLLFLAALFAAGCASTLPSSYSFDPTGDDALVLIDRSLARGHMLILEGVDLEAGAFSGPRRVLTVGMGNELNYVHIRTPLAEYQTSAYVTQLPPGDYVIAGYQTISYPNSTTVCYGRGTPVFRVEPEVANVLAMGGVRIVGPHGIEDGPAGDSIIVGIREALSGLSGIPSDIRVVRAQPIAEVRWEREMTVGSFLTGENCPEARGFEVVRDTNEHRNTPAITRETKPESLPVASSD